MSWTDGDTLAARVSKPSDEPVSTDATLKSLTASVDGIEDGDGLDNATSPTSG